MFFSKFRVFTVHINPTLAKPHEEAVFVEEGFNVKAFIFSALWLLYYRIWWPAFAVIVGNLMIEQMGEEGTVTHIGQAILHLGFNLFVGYEANNWLRGKLARRGFIMSDIVTGDSLVRAEQRFFDRYYTQAAAQ